AHPPAIERPQQRRERGDAQRAEPPRLPVRWCNGELERRALLVPDAAVVRGDDAEAIAARIEVGVESLPPIAGVVPVAIAAFELVLELHLLGRYQARRRVLDLKVAHERRKTHT